MSSYFVVEIYDEKTGCIREDFEFYDSSVESVESVLGIEEFQSGDEYELDKCDIISLNAKYGLNVDCNEWLVKVREKYSIDNLPYKIHTHRELALMLRGEKPFSVFESFGLSEFRGECGIVEYFEPYVSSGQIVKREVFDETIADKFGGICRVMYALRNEEWRIDAYLLLKDVAKHCGWSEGFERMEGRLLGYTEEQNDLFIKHLQKMQNARD